MSDFASFIAECVQTLPENLKHLRSDIGAHFEHKLKHELKEKNVLLRDEFTVLEKVVKKLEQRITALEEKISGAEK